VDLETHEARFHVVSQLDIDRLPVWTRVPAQRTLSLATLDQKEDQEEKAGYRPSYPGEERYRPSYRGEERRILLERDKLEEEGIFMDHWGDRNIDQLQVNGLNELNSDNGLNELNSDNGLNDPNSDNFIPIYDDNIIDAGINQQGFYSGPRVKVGGARGVEDLTRSNQSLMDDMDGTICDETLPCDTTYDNSSDELTEQDGSSCQYDESRELLNVCGGSSLVDHVTGPERRYKTSSCDLLEADQSATHPPHCRTSVGYRASTERLDYELNGLCSGISAMKLLKNMDTRNNMDEMYQESLALRDSKLVLATLGVNRRAFIAGDELVVQVDACNQSSSPVTAHVNFQQVWVAIDLTTMDSLCFNRYR